MFLNVVSIEIQDYNVVILLTDIYGYLHCIIKAATMTGFVFTLIITLWTADFRAIVEIHVALNVRSSKERTLFYLLSGILYLDTI